ncbi:MAG: type II toxin-antitoxin system VapB family antitoxin [Gaiellaceae bacterium MAG52_C11]|nr:type II toxin-antitoxin system VapB family antitoxin [Candidatus Gaiellasilicea maunaloa]
MRTTVRIDEHVLADAKAVAVRTGRTLTAVIEDALRESLARSRKSEPAQHDELPAHSARLQPGVDLDDSSALLDLMEEGRY